ncbi:MAG: SPFH domain-containing protein [Planctomycetes bacterium]|nr:SPFH domain-containing protein [Planctomycetota bacterium]
MANESSSKLPGILGASAHGLVVCSVALVLLALNLNVAALALVASFMLFGAISIYGSVRTALRRGKFVDEKSKSANDESFLPEKQALTEFAKFGKIAFETLRALLPAGAAATFVTTFDADSIANSMEHFAILGFVLLFASFLLTLEIALLSRIENPAPEIPGLIRILRLTSLASATIAFSLLIVRYFESFFVIILIASWALFAIVVAMAIEQVLRTLFGFFASDADLENTRFGTEFFTVDLLCYDSVPLRGFAKVLKLHFGMDLEGSYALRFTRRISLWLTLSMALVFYLLTAFTIVAPGERAIRERFGATREGEILEPGLHFGLPYPLDRIVRVDAERIKTIEVGTGGAENEALVFTYKSDDEPYYFARRGDSNRALIGFDLAVQYRITDLREYLHSSQNPDTRLSAMAREIVSRMCASFEAGDLLLGIAGDADVSLYVREALVNAAEKEKLGIEIVAVLANGIFPPASVAPAFQALMSARLDEETLRLEAKAYESQQLSEAKIDADRLVSGASAARLETVSAARAETMSDAARYEAYKISPALVLWQSRLDALKDALRNQNVIIVDDALSIEGAGGAVEYEFDFRKK